ncbi:unnamed protein product, partial [Ectocarpus fasciculatus]
WRRPRRKTLHCLHNSWRHQEAEAARTGKELFVCDHCVHACLPICSSPAAAVYYRDPFAILAELLLLRLLPLCWLWCSQSQQRSQSVFQPAEGELNTCIM